MEKLFDNKIEDFDKNVGRFLLLISRMENFYNHFLTRSFSFEYSKYYALLQIFEDLMLSKKCDIAKELCKSYSAPEDVLKIINDSMKYNTTRNTLAHGDRSVNLSKGGAVESRNLSKKDRIIDEIQLLEELKSLKNHLEQLTQKVLLEADQIRTKMESKKGIPYPKDRPGLIHLLTGLPCL